MDEPRDLGGDRLGLGAAAGGAQQGQVGGLGERLRRERREAEAAGERVELGALGVPRVGVEADLLDRLERAQSSQQLPAGRQRLVAVLEGDRDGHLGVGGERGDEVELGRGEVVEPV